MIDLQKFKNRQTIRELFNAIADRYDFINTVLSFGRDKAWRRSLLRYLPKRRGLKVVDLATGTGEQIRALKKDGRIENMIGIDISEKMLELARKKLQHSMPPVHLLLGNALRIPLEDASCDVVTMTFGLRNTSDAAKCLSEMRRILKPGGVSLIVEFSLPALWLRPFHLFYLRHALPQVGAFLSKNREAYRYLNLSIEEFFQPRELSDLLMKAGFKEVRLHSKTGGIVTVYEAMT